MGVGSLSVIHRLVIQKAGKRCWDFRLHQGAGKGVDKVPD